MPDDSCRMLFQHTWRRRRANGVSLRVQCDVFVTAPVARGAAIPAVWAARLCLCINRSPGFQHGAVGTGMPFRRGDVMDTAVTMFMVVPVHNRLRPLRMDSRLGRFGSGQGKGRLLSHTFRDTKAWPHEFRPGSYTPAHMPAVWRPCEYQPESGGHHRA